MFRSVIFNKPGFMCLDAQGANQAQARLGVGENESPRELRRFHYLREWSHEQDKQVFT